MTSCPFDIRPRNTFIEYKYDLDSNSERKGQGL